jgi:hypothetical protein
MADEEEPASLLSQLEASVTQEGHDPSSPQFQHRLDQLKVIKCREMRGHPVCSDCEVFDFCELVKRVMRHNQGYDEEP